MFICISSLLDYTLRVGGLNHLYLLKKIVQKKIGAQICVFNSKVILPAFIEILWCQLMLHGESLTVTIR